VKQLRQPSRKAPPGQDVPAEAPWTKPASTLTYTCRQPRGGAELAVLRTQRDVVISRPHDPGRRGGDGTGRAAITRRASPCTWTKVLGPTLPRHVVVLDNLRVHKAPWACLTGWAGPPFVPLPPHSPDFTCRLNGP
jgi:hypothetical protein